MKFSVAFKTAIILSLLGTAAQGFSIRSVADFSFPHTRNDLSSEDQTRVQNVTLPTSDFSRAEKFESNSAGAATSHKQPNDDAFSHPSQNLDFEEKLTFHLGDALFGKLWVTPPSSTHASDGLGPLYNARSCQSCHVNDGRGHPPEGEAGSISMFLRLARKPSSDAEKILLASLDLMKLPDPVYGGQLQDRAVPGLQSEGRMKITYQEISINMGNGEIVYLRKPTYTVVNLGYGPLHADTVLSPRIAPPMIGMGLIQAIHPSDIQRNADPQDRDNNGISGKMALARDAVTGKLMLGRFGWKASNPTIRTQTASAFANDIGISTPDIKKHYGDCTIAQDKCLEQPNGVQLDIGEVEAPDPDMDLVTFYSENLAVPARRRVANKQILAGKETFYSLGCISCHTPKFVTRRDAENKAHRFQLIWPYSDFLLHDLGDGLGDGQQVGVANGREWRTPPLWGIGLTKTVSRHSFFLHDGRARNFTEAVLWHGGEAKASRDGFVQLSKQQRTNLILFLESL